MQVIQPSSGPVTPKDDHLALHEGSSSPKPGCWGRPISGGAVPCPCRHIQEVDIIETLPVCSAPTKYYQPGWNRYYKFDVLHQQHAVVCLFCSFAQHPTVVAAACYRHKAGAHFGGT